MSYIAPNTDLRILRACPLVNDYVHTIYFGSPVAQSTYFISLTKYNLADYSYQRHSINKIRVGICSDDLFDCNYLMFKNTSFGSKWFYAFITEVEYVNNVTAEITFEVDVIQTWMFDYTREPCYVIREHAMNDAIGANIIPEKFSPKEYIFNSYGAIDQTSDMAVIALVMDTGASEGSPNFGALYDGVYSGAKMYAFKASDSAKLTSFLQNYVLRPDAIVGLYMCPMNAFTTAITTGEQREVDPTNSGRSLTITLGNLIGTEQLNGHTVRNNKLFTYPYTFYHVDNGNGTEINLRYEWFTDRRPTFELCYSLLQPVTVTLYPTHYEGINLSDHTESLALTDYPLCSWGIDTYKAWTAQNAISNLVYKNNNILAWMGFGASDATASNAKSGIVGVGLDNAFAAADRQTPNAFNAITTAGMCKGNITNGNNLIAHGYMRFYGGMVSVTGQMAEVIDSYFDMFGYATNKIKVPNISGRAHWNYVKTSDYAVVGSIPASHAKKIADIHNNGITYWRNGSEVGNYGLDNSLS